MEKFICLRFGRKSGKIDKSLEGLGCGMLQLWALQNTTKTKDTVIFSAETGKIKMYVEGREGFPEVQKDMENRNIEELCPGILAAVRKDSNL